MNDFNKMSNFKPANPSANKPVYLVKTEDPSIKEKCIFYRVRKLDKNDFFIVIYGYAVSKTQADKLRTEKDAEIEANKEINIEIPWHRVISIENVTYKKA